MPPFQIFDLTGGKEIHDLMFLQKRAINVCEVTDNDLNGVLNCYEAPNIDIDKSNIIQMLIDNVDKKLESGGIFVLGDHPQEHIFMADKYTKPENTCLYDKIRNIYFITESPVLKAFQKNGNFKPIFYKDIQFPFSELSIRLPLIWQKIK
ncbi:MAG: hypothetical protein MJ237_07095 [bacterium]|nr:hypothetical protein [bacterium]